MNDIYIENIKLKTESIKSKYPNSVFLNVTSSGKMPWRKFSPFYPHGLIPIPNSNDHFSETVEGVWQGLKVFQNSGISDFSFKIKSMKDIKRNSLTNGKIIGHQYGIKSNEILDYFNARKLIYLPVYQFILQNYLQSEIKELKKILTSNSIVLLDYDTNCDILNLKKPLSHSYLIKQYLIGKYDDLYLMNLTTYGKQTSLF